MKRWLVLFSFASMATAHAQAPAAEPSFVNEGIVDAPIQDVWKVWSTSEGYRALGVALAELDLRPGGVIRSRYKPDGRLGDEQTIENEILAYDPPRMIAIRIRKTPADFPFKEAWKHMWTVVTLTPLDGNRTHLRVSSLGYGSDPESLAMRRFFESGNEHTLKTLAASFAKWFVVVGAEAARPIERAARLPGAAEIVLMTSARRHPLNPVFAAAGRCSPRRHVASCPSRFCGIHWMDSSRGPRRRSLVKGLLMPPASTSWFTLALRDRAGYTGACRLSGLLRCGSSRVGRRLIVSSRQIFLTQTGEMIASGRVTGLQLQRP